MIGNINSPGLTYWFVELSGWLSSVDISLTTKVTSSVLCCWRNAMQYIIACHTQFVYNWTAVLLDVVFYVSVTLLSGFFYAAVYRGVTEQLEDKEGMLYHLGCGFLLFDLWACLLNGPQMASPIFPLIFTNLKITSFVFPFLINILPNSSSCSRDYFLPLTCNLQLSTPYSVLNII